MLVRCCFVRSNFSPRKAMNERSTDCSEDDFASTRLETSESSAKKRRRGVIEKRRRDRINKSLSELRRMVPSTLERRGCVKMEKAEILQLTVEHLKKLQDQTNPGFYPFVDGNGIALNFLNIGFRECVSELSRYMTSEEGMDAEHPLRIRLLRHLHNKVLTRGIYNQYSWKAWDSLYAVRPCYRLPTNNSYYDVVTAESAARTFSNTNFSSPWLQDKRDLETSSVEVPPSKALICRSGNVFLPPKY